MDRFGRRIRYTYVVVVGFVFISQFYICILDRMLHTLFVFSLFMAAIYVFAYLYAERGARLFKRLAGISTAMALATLLGSTLWSLSAFNSLEMFNAGIGYVCVKAFDKDAFCISNGRESEITAALPRDLYITDGIRSEEGLAKHFQNQYPELNYYLREDGYALAFYTTDKDTPVIAALKNSHSGYDIWEVLAIDAYRYKNIWGRVSAYKNPGIKPRY